MVSPWILDQVLLDDLRLVHKVVIELHDTHLYKYVHLYECRTIDMGSW